MMASKQTDALIDKMIEMIEKHGIGDYVIAIRDPDSNNDLIHTDGSIWWRMGVGIELIESSKERRRQSWEEDDDNEDQ